MEEPVKPVSSFLSKGETVILRELRLDDCSGILNCMNSVVARKAYIGRKTIKTMKEQEEDMHEWLKYMEDGEAIFVVAELAGRVVGHTSIEKYPPYLFRLMGNFVKRIFRWDGMMKFFYKYSKTGCVGVVLVHADMQGRGIGENLTLAVIAEAQKAFGMKRLFLQTSVPNKNAIKLYEKLGFKKTGRKMKPRDHYGEREERMEMVKELRP